MSIFSLIQSRLTSLLLALLFLCTAVLGALIMGVQRMLFWLDGQHPRLHHITQLVTGFLNRHPKTISATLASVLLVGGGGAFALAASLALAVATCIAVSACVPIAPGVPVPSAVAIPITTPVAIALRKGRSSIRGRIQQLGHTRQRQGQKAENSD